MKEILKKLADAAKTYIMSNGGMSNGYETTITGYVTLTAIGRTLEITTPHSDGATLREVKDKGTHLSRLLRGILKEEGVSQSEKFVFTSTHREHGCFSIRVSHTEAVTL